MQKMLIQLDEKKIIEDDEYFKEDLWKAIDKVFEERQCIKEINNDSSVTYCGNPNRDNYLADFSIAYMTLNSTKWFARYVSKWIWYDNDDDENLPFSEEDVLAKEIKRNPLFTNR